MPPPHEPNSGPTRNDVEVTSGDQPDSSAAESKPTLLPQPISTPSTDANGSSQPSNSSISTKEQLGIVQLMMTDFPIEGFDVQRVLVTFTHVDVYSATRGWQTVEDFRPDGRTLDLMSIRDGVFTELGGFFLPVEKYDQIRLHMTDQHTIEILENGVSVTKPMKIPSGEQTGIKLVRGFEVTQYTPTTFMLDFDAAQSITYNKGQGFSLNPTIKILDVTSTPTITSTITATSGGAVRVLGTAEVQIPAGSVSQDTVVSMTLDPVPHVRSSENVIPVTSRIELGPDGATFANGVTLTMHYDDDVVAALGLREEDLDIYYHDAATDERVATNAVVDTANNRIVATITHFSHYDAGAAPARGLCSVPIAEELQASNDWWPRDFFTPSCNRHDECFHHGSVTYNFSRHYCDLEWWNLMRDQCDGICSGDKCSWNYQLQASEAICMETAEAYYSAVRENGADSFRVENATCSDYLGLGITCHATECTVSGPNRTERGATVPVELNANGPVLLIKREDDIVYHIDENVIPYPQDFHFTFNAYPTPENPTVVFYLRSPGGWNSCSHTFVVTSNLPEIAELTPSISSEYPPANFDSSAPGVANWSRNRLDVFAKGSDAALHHIWTDGSSQWSGWESLGGVLQSAPAAVSWEENRIDVFGRGSDDALWHRFWNGSSWVGWESLGGVLTSAPTVASWEPNRLDVFARGVAPELMGWHTYWTGADWIGWEPLGGVLNSAPAAISWGPNRVDVFANGTDAGLWHTWWDGFHWYAWESLGKPPIDGGIVSSPTAVSRFEGHLEVFAVGSDRKLWRIGFFDATGTWSDWALVGGSNFFGDPSAVAIDPFHVEVFLRDNDNCLLNITLTASSSSSRCVSPMP